MERVVGLLFSILMLPVSGFADTRDLEQGSFARAGLVLPNFLPSFGPGLIPLWSDTPLLPGTFGSDFDPLSGGECEPEIDPFAYRDLTTGFPGTTTVSSRDCVGIVKAPSRPEGCVGDVACAPPLQYD